MKLLEPGKESPPLFEITSAYICEKDGPDKKYVMYTLQVRHASGKEDALPATIDRRYTDFLNLCTELRKEFPELMGNVQFPKKVLLGNFDNVLIASRSTGFEAFLQHVSSIQKLHSSHALRCFLQNEELNKAKDLISKKEYSYAMSVLENMFRLLSNIYTDRSPVVLFALCRLLGCSVLLPGSPNADKWADLALHRFMGVSDSELLVLYLPLLKECIKVGSHKGKDTERLEKMFAHLLRQGLKLNQTLTFLEMVEQVEGNVLESR